MGANVLLVRNVLLHLFLTHTCEFAGQLLHFIKCSLAVLAIDAVLFLVKTLVHLRVVFFGPLFIMLDTWEGNTIISIRILIEHADTILFNSYSHSLDILDVLLEGASLLH